MKQHLCVCIYRNCLRGYIAICIYNKKLYCPRAPIVDTRGRLLIFSHLNSWSQSCQSIVRHLFIMPCKSSVILELRRIAHTYTYCIWHVNHFIHPSVAHLFYSAFQIKSAWSGRPASDWWSTGQWNERYLLPAIQTANRVRQEACQATGQCALCHKLCG